MKRIDKAERSAIILERFDKIFQEALADLTSDIFDDQELSAIAEEELACRIIRCAKKYTHFTGSDTRVCIAVLSELCRKNMLKVSTLVAVGKEKDENSADFDTHENARVVKATIDNRDDDWQISVTIASGGKLFYLYFGHGEMDGGTRITVVDHDQSPSISDRTRLAVFDDLLKRLGRKSPSVLNDAKGWFRDLYPELYE